MGPFLVGGNLLGMGAPNAPRRLLFSTVYSTLLFVYLRIYIYISMLCGVGGYSLYVVSL
jgi:hypothetical protein